MFAEGMAAQDTSSRARARAPIPDAPRARSSANPPVPSSPGLRKQANIVDNNNTAPDRDQDSPRTKRKGLDALTARSRTGPNTSGAPVAPPVAGSGRATATAYRSAVEDTHEDDDDLATVASSTTRSYTSTYVKPKGELRRGGADAEGRDTLRSSTHGAERPRVRAVPRGATEAMEAPPPALPTPTTLAAGGAGGGGARLPLIRVNSVQPDQEERQLGRAAAAAAASDGEQSDGGDDGAGDARSRFGGMRSDLRRAAGKDDEGEGEEDEDGEATPAVGPGGRLRASMAREGAGEKAVGHGVHDAHNDGHVEDPEDDDDDDDDEHEGGDGGGDGGGGASMGGSRTHLGDPSGVQSRAMPRARDALPPPTARDGSAPHVHLRRPRPAGADDTVSVRSHFTHADTESHTSRRASGNLSSMLDDMSLMGDATSRPMLRLEARFEPPTVGDKLAGNVHVHVREGQSIRGYRYGNAVALTPYVKLYISQNGIDVKDTKQKTKDHKGETAPKFNERFIFYLRRGMPIDERTRLQITLWDRNRFGASSCLGGFSFTIPELAGSVAGWFEVIEEVAGRLRNCPVNPDAPQPEGLLQRQHSISTFAGSVASLPTNGKRRHQREEHYLAQLQELQGRIERQSHQIFELQTDLEAAQARERDLMRLEEDNQHLRLELANYVSEKEKLVKQCKDLEGIVSELRDGTISPPIGTTPLRGALATSMRRFDSPDGPAGSPAGAAGVGGSAIAAARARDRHMISFLQSRLGDAHDEITTLRAYNGRLADELLRLSPKAMTRAAMPFA